MECGMLNLNKGFLLLTYKMEYHDVARADREAGRLGDIYRISDKCRPFFVRPRACFHCVVFRVPKNGTLETKKPPAMQVSQHCFSLQ